jgi:DnaJ-class molecular chaperone
VKGKRKQRLRALAADRRLRGVPKCPRCNGTIVVPNSVRNKCTTCDGTGFLGDHAAALLKKRELI